MSLKSTHPQYDAHVAYWEKMRDTYAGEDAIKAKGLKYLPPTAGMREDGMEPNNPGLLYYESYKARAVFHEYVSEAVVAMLGIMHRKPANIQLPEKLKPLMEKCSLESDSLQHFLRRINEQQLVTGRVGILADFPIAPTTADVLPYLSLYLAESIVNWDDSRTEAGEHKLNMVVLDESTYERKGPFDWQNKTQHRVLALGSLSENADSGEYRWGIFQDDAFDEGSMRPASYRGTALDEIPFVFVNTMDCVATPAKPPLLGLANLCLTIYRGEADYRQNLFMQGQDTLVVSGSVREPEKAIRVGAGARIDVEQDGDAKFIGVNSNGLPEQRIAIDADKKRAVTKTMQLVSSEKGIEESGVALQTRIAAQAATLLDIALAGGVALQKILRLIAKWVGANPEEVIVKPNTEFAEFQIMGDELLKLMQARALGAPISLESIHTLLRDRSMVQYSYDEEMDKLSSENSEFGLPSAKSSASSAAGKAGIGLDNSNDNKQQ